MDNTTEMEELVAKLEKLTEIMERHYSPLSKMDRLEASVNAMEKAVNTLADSVDRLLSSSIGLDKTVESVLTTDEHRVTPLPIHMDREFCDDQQDRSKSIVASDSQTGSTSFRRLLFPEARINSCENFSFGFEIDDHHVENYFEPFHIEGNTIYPENHQLPPCLSSLDLMHSDISFEDKSESAVDEDDQIGIQIQTIAPSTEIEASQEVAKEVHNYLSIHPPVFSYFSNKFCKEIRSNYSADLCYNDLTWFAHIGKIHVETKISSDLVFDPGGIYGIEHLLLYNLAYYNMSSIYLRKYLMICTQEFRAEVTSLSEPIFSMYDPVDQAKAVGLILVSPSGRAPLWSEGLNKILKKLLYFYGISRGHKICYLEHYLKNQNFYKVEIGIINQSLYAFNRLVEDIDIMYRFQAIIVFFAGCYSSIDLGKDSQDILNKCRCQDTLIIRYKLSHVRSSFQMFIPRRVCIGKFSEVNNKEKNVSSDPNRFWIGEFTKSQQAGHNNIPNGPAKPPSQLFVRTQMLFRGSLMRLGEGGGSTIHIVDHKNLEYWSVLEVNLIAGGVPNACTSLALLDPGKVVFNRIIHYALENYVYVGNSLVNMYAKYGNVCYSAVDVFHFYTYESKELELELQKIIGKVEGKNIYGSNFDDFATLMKMGKASCYDAQWLVASQIAFLFFIALQEGTTVPYF
ncbi:homeobox-leucine zipper protein ATHB-8 [Senna tora]|uniref:Homeobox-leucine zipper protein ATHB-8 n=1 Tax=Senna tora TaxID=362788 RepID=A0A834W7P6_9FABA|nr:homeobox-leucine zipper protein ATHB-8 [Senna tora]